MSVDGLVFGLLDTSSLIGHPRVAEKYRGFTISWSRYDYHGPILERRTVDEILAAARGRGQRYCYIQSYGNIICERWTLTDWFARDFCAALRKWIGEHEFLIAGSIVGNHQQWYGIEPRCLLVDLDVHARLSAPSFDLSSSGPVQLPKPLPTLEGGRVTAVRSSDEFQCCVPVFPGWSCIAESLRAGIPVLDLGDDIRRHTLWLDPDCPSRRKSFSHYLDEGILEYGHDCQPNGLSGDQHEFLTVVARQAQEARQGVFLFNIESYDDVETPPDDFQKPVSTLYSVASGFKPNRILETHGFDEDTRVVFFDYSPNALNVKRCMVDEWDGDDFPDFVRYLFKVFPYPGTFYHLWDDVSPEEVDWKEMESVWRQELARWGGAIEWRKHWRRYRRLRHEYVCCDIVDDPSSLLESVTPEPRAVLWWSNAFFTMVGNWFWTLSQREARYRYWIEQLASRDPELFLYGSDYNNTNVNYIQAGEYWEQFRQSGATCLEPCRMMQKELRM